MAKYIEFEVIEEKPKTKVWGVQAKEGAFLGKIKWYGAWRCYIFEPESETLYEKQCMRDIADFLDEQTSKLRATWQKK